MNGVQQNSSQDGDADLVTDSSGASGEVSRFMRLAKSHRRNGDIPREERVLRALRAVIVHAEAYGDTIAEIDTQLKFLDKRRKLHGDKVGLPQQAIKQAETLIDEGRINDALSVLDGLTVLYQDDAEASKYVHRAEELQRRIADATPPVGSD